MFRFLTRLIPPRTPEADKAQEPEEDSKLKFLTLELKPQGPVFIPFEEMEHVNGPDGVTTRSAPAEFFGPGVKSYITQDGMWFGLPPHCIYATADGEHWTVYEHLNPETAPEFFQDADPAQGYPLKIWCALDFKAGKVWMDLPRGCVFDSERGAAFRELRPETVAEYTFHRSRHVPPSPGPAPRIATEGIPETAPENLPKYPRQGFPDTGEFLLAFPTVMPKPPVSASGTNTDALNTGDPETENGATVPYRPAEKESPMRVTSFSWRPLKGHKYSDILAESPARRREILRTIQKKYPHTPD